MQNPEVEKFMNEADRYYESLKRPVGPDTRLCMECHKEAPEHRLDCSQFKFRLPFSVSDGEDPKVLAERERCAKIADAVADDPHGSNPACAAAEEIAADIRSGKSPESPESAGTLSRNGVLYEVLPDGGLRHRGGPNSMTYEYDAATGKRCRVSRLGEYLGEWF